MKPRAYLDQATFDGSTARDEVCGLLTRFYLDVVHAHHYEGLIVAKMALGRRIPLIYDAHTMLDCGASLIRIRRFRVAQQKNRSLHRSPLAADGGSHHRRHPDDQRPIRKVRDYLLRFHHRVTNGVEPEMFGDPDAMQIPQRLRPERDIHGKRRSVPRPGSSVEGFSHGGRPTDRCQVGHRDGEGVFRVRDGRSRRVNQEFARMSISLPQTDSNIYGNFCPALTWR